MGTVSEARRSCLHVPTALGKSFHTVNQPTHADIMCNSDSDSDSNSNSNGNNNNNNNNFHLWSAHIFKSSFKYSRYADIEAHAKSWFESRRFKIASEIIDEIANYAKDKRSSLELHLK
ncbi:hypothetical protein GQX74_008036 [Glossina fuscipes]|nr:hypothetical protein GQX74_008036 [Glossina fuscipes]